MSLAYRELNNGSECFDEAQHERKYLNDISLWPFALRLVEGLLTNGFFSKAGRGDCRLGRYFVKPSSLRARSRKLESATSSIFIGRATFGALARGVDERLDRSLGDPRVFSQDPRKVLKHGLRHLRFDTQRAPCGSTSNRRSVTSLNSSQQPCGRMVGSKKRAPLSQAAPQTWRAVSTTTSNFLF